MSGPGTAMLDIHSDTHADIVTDDVRFPLRGVFARAIIAHYQHCRDDPRHGPNDADLFLWGVVEGMAYWQAKELNDLIA